jgi:uncharacterized protein YukE
MGTAFSVEPAALIALGKLYTDLGTGGSSTSRYVRNFAQPNSADFTGLILPLLVDPLNNLRTSTADRWQSIGTNLSSTGKNLNDAGWSYFTQDHQNADRIATAGGGTSGGRTAGDANGPHVGSASALALAEPVKQEVDTKSIAEAAADWLADCNGAIKSLTGWDPVGEVLHEVAGNWMALKTLGEAYDKGASALETIGKDAAGGSRAVDPFWDGHAAATFTDHSSKLVRGIEWESSVGRLINRGLTMVADDLNKAAIAAIKFLKEGLSRFVKIDSFAGLLKMAARFVPYAGQAATATQIIQLINDVRDKVMPLIGEIRRGVEAFKAFVEVAKDPMGAAQHRAEQSVDKRLAPYRDKLEKGEQARQDLSDVTTAIEIDRVTEQPKAAWDLGDRRRMRDDE